jgi:hypothetical protein
MNIQKRLVAFDKKSSEKVGLGSHYEVKPSGYAMEVDDYRIEPMIYQPTPIGVDLLCTHLSEKLKIQMVCLDQRDSVSNWNLQLDRFRDLAARLKFLPSFRELPLGVILSHGQGHATPVVLSHFEGTDRLTIFDSTSGMMLPTYFQVANAFPEFEVGLNKGTRQSDKTSCITDALVILPIALQADVLATTAHPDYRVELPPKRKSRFIGPTLSQDNFYLFRLSERLLVTAQNPLYVEDSAPDLSVVISDSGLTLGDFKAQHRTTVALNGERPRDLDVDRYLHLMSHEHARLIDALLLKVSF